MTEARKIKRILCVFAALAILMQCAACGRREISDGELIIEQGENNISLPVYGADSLNPIRTLSKSAAQALFAVYEPLFGFDDKLAAQGVLAKSAELAPDGMSASVLLADGVKWHDGTDFCAEDVVYTINEIKAGDSLYKDNVAPISRAVTDGGSVRLEFYEPVMNVEGLLSFPIIKNGSAAYIEDLPCGTGAFEFASKTSNSLRLVSKTGAADELKLCFMRNSAACISALEAGEVDVVSSAVGDLDSETPGGNISVHSYTSNRLTLLGFNCRLEKYKEPYLRMVICELIDRQRLIDNAYYGRADASLLPINPRSAYYVPTNSLMLDAAKTMERAGFYENGGVYADADANLVRLAILVPDTNLQRVNCANMTAGMLKDFGISADVEVVGFDEYSARVQRGDFDTFLGEINMQPSLDPGFLTRGENYFGFYSEELDAAARRLADDPESYARCFAENPPFVPLLYAHDRVICRSALSGISEPTFYSEYRGIENWYFKAAAGEGANE